MGASHGFNRDTNRIEQGRAGALIVPVVLCGGSGTRLWPLSRKLYPKQFHCLHSENSLLQETAIRAGRVSGGDALVVVTNDDQRFLVADQLQAFRGVDILIEPEAKNTAPAIALAAMFAQQKYTDPVLLVMPSDHLINDSEAFCRVVALADRWAQQGKMVTFGIPPATPDTGYGYIEQGDAVDAANDAFVVKRFVEKPDVNTAQALVDSGTHVWNSGIFMFGASTFLDELRALSPQVYDRCAAAMTSATVHGNFVAAAEAEFASCPNISIDYAVMEHTDKAVVVPFEGDWSDIGSWGGLVDALSGQGGNSGTAENITVGKVYTKDVSNSYIHATDRLVAAVGIKDSIIVETDDAVLVTTRQSDQKIKELVEQLRCDGRREAEHHTRVYRPWGSYQTLDLREGCQVKRLIVKPGASISLQLHHRRSEHWVVVKGEALVTKGEENFTLVANQSTYIPRETLHKLENRSDCDLEIIEVQTGDYLGEDDIERFADKYGRT
jgi:mannose-1-phosphate guanylyltransferase/mannose-6-phosphate isomerase